MNNLFMRYCSHVEELEKIVDDMAEHVGEHYNLNADNLSDEDLTYIRNRLAEKYNIVMNF